MRVIAAYRELHGVAGEVPLGPIPSDDRDRVDYHRAERALRRAQNLQGAAQDTGLGHGVLAADAAER